MKKWLLISCYWMTVDLGLFHSPLAHQGFKIPG
jgi:phenylalanine-4-hydroxylase